jgi:raffinose/stachyose/melibiose transport system substrate-binding protein
LEPCSSGCSDLILKKKESLFISIKLGGITVKKNLTMLTVMMLILTVLAACGSKTSSPESNAKTEEPKSEATSTSTEKEEPVTLKFLHFVPYSKAALDKFHEKYPHITIQFEQVDTANYTTVLKSRLAAKADVDIIGLHATPEELGWAVNNNTLIDLTGASYLDNIMPAAVQAATVDGKPYGFAQGTYAIGVWYNKDIFENAGVAIPTNWDEFLSAAEQIKQTGVAPLVVSGKDSWTTTYYTMSKWTELETEQSGILEKLKTGEAKWTDPEFTNGYKQMEQLVSKGYFLNGNGAVGITYDQAVLAFQQGKAAMWIMGSWALDKFADDFKDINVGVFPYPTNDAGKQPLVPQVTDSLLSGIAWSKHQDAVQKFIEFSASVESGSLQAADQKIVSTVKGATADFHPLAKEWLPLFDVAKPEPTALISTAAVNEAGAQMQKLLIGGKAEEVVATLQKIQENDNKSAQ